MPTRFPEGNTLDLMYTNYNSLMNDIQITPTAYSDHQIIRIIANISLETNEQQSKPKSFNTPSKSFNFNHE